MKNCFIIVLAIMALSACSSAPQTTSVEVGKVPEGAKVSGTFVEHDPFDGRLKVGGYLLNEGQKPLQVVEIVTHLFLKDGSPDGSPITGTLEPLAPGDSIAFYTAWISPERPQKAVVDVAFQ